MSDCDGDDDGVAPCDGDWLALCVKLGLWLGVSVKEGDWLGVWVPVVDGDCVWLGEAVWDVVLLGVADCELVRLEDCDDVALTDRVWLALCDCVGVGEHASLRPLRRTPAYASSGDQEAPASADCSAATAAPKYGVGCPAGVNVAESYHTSEVDPTASVTETK